MKLLTATPTVSAAIVRRCACLTALLVVAIIAGPAQAAPVVVSDPAGDSTCGAGCPDLTSVSETRSGKTLEFRFESATPWGSVLPELDIWTTNPDSAQPNVMLAADGQGVDAVSCGDWADRNTCSGGNYADVSHPSATTVVYSFSAFLVGGDVSHRWRAAVAHQPSGSPDPQPYDRAPDGAPAPGIPPPDADGDGIPDSRDSCVNSAGPDSNDGCPETAQRPTRYLLGYYCNRGNRRTFEYVFRPRGGSGPGTPTSFSNAAYGLPMMTADSSRPHVSIYYQAGSAFPDTRWAAYADTHAYARPRSHGACVTAGPQPHFTTRQWLRVPHTVSTTRPTAVKCSYRNKFGGLAFLGVRGAGTPRVDTVIAHDVQVANGRIRGNHTFLRIRLTGRRPMLLYDRDSCRRIRVHS